METVELLARLAITVAFPVLGIILVVRQIRRRPAAEDTFLQHEDEWGAR